MTKQWFNLRRSGRTIRAIHRAIAYLEEGKNVSFVSGKGYAAHFVASTISAANANFKMLSHSTVVDTVSRGRVVCRTLSPDFLEDYLWHTQHFDNIVVDHHIIELYELKKNENDFVLSYVERGSIQPGTLIVSRLESSNNVSFVTRSHDRAKASYLTVSNSMQVLAKSEAVITTRGIEWELVKDTLFLQTDKGIVNLPNTHIDQVHIIR